MDYRAKQCAVKYETAKSNSSRKQDKKGLDTTACNLINILLLKDGSPVPPEKDTSDETSVTLDFDTAQPDVQSDSLETEAVSVGTVVKNDANIKSDVKEVLETVSKPDISKVTPPQKAGSNKTLLSEKRLNVTDSEMQHDSIFTEETDSEPKALRKVVPPTASSSTEQPSKAVKSEITKQTVQQTDSEQNLTEHVREPLVPLGQRSSRCKPRRQIPAAEVQKVDSQKSSEVQKMDSQKSQQMDDLDFVLALKNPLKEAPTSSLKPQVTVSAIEDGKLRFQRPRLLFSSKYFMCLFDVSRGCVAAD
jgi:hypothetical protein